ncbi:unnamed protein product [Linum trigynum]|uniref:Replication protein A 70 kDa DNA-binding subunit B/D first OB fold domain-containing protein n=1 Tax=Linum trigynum TaxID=586398 RepID=A0AAV2G7E2_9ROSI
MTLVSIAELATAQQLFELQCRVSRKWIPYHAKKDTIISLDFVVIDSEGNDIWAQVPLDSVRIFGTQLEDKKCYLLATFKLTSIKEDFCPVPNPLMIQFNGDTTVQPIDPIPTAPPSKFPFIKVVDISKYHNVTVDLLFGLLITYRLCFLFK